MKQLEFGARELVKPRFTSGANANLLKILIVDDDNEDTINLQDLIEEAVSEYRQLEFATACSYEEALKVLKDQSFDLLFVDFRMGYMSGLELVKKIRELKIKTPVVFITGQDCEATASYSLKQGASDYVIKDNLSRDAVLETLEKHFSFVSSIDHKHKSYNYFMKLDDLIKA